MAASTEAVTLSSTAYVALSSGQATVLIHAEAPIRVSIGTSLPSADTDNWFPLEAGGEMQFDGMGAADIVYAKPGLVADTASKVRVLRK